jgi:AcrR family transcriptional regulator
MTLHSARHPNVRRRRNNPEGLRSRILDRAVKLFQERGYHSTSMHDLIRATNTTAGALHHHFPTKKAIALAVLAERVRPLVRQTWIDPIRQAPALDKGVAEVFDEIIPGIKKRRRVLGCPLNNLALELALSDRDLREGIEDVFSEWRAALAERIGRTPGGTGFDEKERTAAANFIISVYSGAMNLAKATQSPGPLADAAALLTQWLREHHLAA